MGKLFRELLDWISRFQAAQSIIAFAKPALWPVVYAVLTGAAGYLGNLPVMWILMSTSLAFMGGVVGIFFIEARQTNRSPANKLRYTGTLVNYELQPQPRRERRGAQAIERKALTTAPPVVQRHLEKTQIGVQLHNNAPFPISLVVISAETEMEGMFPPRTSYPKPPVVILPGNVVFVTDEAIPMNGHPCEKLEGRMNIKIKYGLPGKEKHELTFKGKVEALMRPEGFNQMTYTHWDTDQI
jgi:hypothetical protein